MKRIMESNIKDIYEDLIDDMLFELEFFLDNHYQKLEYKDFKKKWYKITSSYKKKLKRINKNTKNYD